jgi:hypothetical protein
VLGSDSGVSALLDCGVIRQWFREHRAGQLDRSNALWAIWMLERWHRTSRVEPAPQVVGA